MAWVGLELELELLELELGQVGVGLGWGWGWRRSRSWIIFMWKAVLTTTLQGEKQSSGDGLGVKKGPEASSTYRRIVRGNTAIR